MLNVAVIGCGVVGLTTAVQIQKDVNDVNVTIFSEKLSPETTGDVAAGLWMPYLVGDTPEELILKWSKTTYKYLEELWKRGDASEAGICLLPLLSLSPEEEMKKEKWNTIPYGFQFLTKNQIERISKQNKDEYNGFHCLTFTCEPSKLLPFLMRQFHANGGQICVRKIQQFTELSQYDIIINCTGLNARELTGDKNLSAIRGQIIRVKAPWQFEILVDGAYIIPNISYVILGGTHQVGNEMLTINETDKKDILNGCIKMQPNLNNCKEYKDGVGLRPGRNRVRLETEKIVIGNRLINIVHNYGHGGAGITLSFGCAQDVSNLVKEIVGNYKFQSHL